MKLREFWRRNGLVVRTSILNDHGMAVSGFSGIFMTPKVLSSLSKVSSDSSTPSKMIAEQENNFWKECEKRYSSIKLLKDTFAWMNLNEIEDSKFKASEHRTPKMPTFICIYPVLVATPSSPSSWLPYKTALRAHSTLEYRQLACSTSCARGAPW